MAQNDLPRLKAIEFLMFGEADVVRTVLDRNCNEFSHLEGQIIELDGIAFRCDAVLEHPAKPPYKKGDHISLITSVGEDEA
jgi:hypothetical protein